jgi:hypothetical protein
MFFVFPGLAWNFCVRATADGLCHRNEHESKDDERNSGAFMIGCDGDHIARLDKC